MLPQSFPQPTLTDAVLGGQSVSITAVVLGGLEGVKRRLFSNCQAARIDGLTQAVNYGAAGIELAIAVLYNPEETLDVRLIAFGLLNSLIEFTELKPYQRILQSKKGDSVTTILPDELAVKMLETLSSDFAQSLWQKSQGWGGLSESQLVWAHKLAISELDKRYKEQTAHKEILTNNILQSFFDLIAKASENLKRPAIRLAVSPEREIKLYQSQMGRYAGAIKIVSPTNRPYGRIQKSESQQILFIKLPDCPDWVADLIHSFAENPVKIAAEYGKLTGRCCFCYKQLTDTRSVEVGYGKSCARNYGLAWGNPSPESSTTPF